MMAAFLFPPYFFFSTKLPMHDLLFLAETTYAIEKNREIINELRTDLKQ